MRLYRNIPTRTNKTGGGDVVSVPAKPRHARPIPQQLHPEQTRLQFMTERLHYALPGQPSSVVYSYPVGVAQFYLWTRHLTQDAPWLQFWGGRTGYGAATRSLRPNQASANIWATGPTTQNTSLRAMIAAAQAAYGGA